MNRKLSMTHDVDKFLARLDAKVFRQIVRRIFLLADNPLPIDATRLQGRDDFRIDVGEYRIVYAFNSDTVYIILIGKRNDDEVYSRLNRK
jgi:mRNA interferase RelE/StbE